MRPARLGEPGRGVFQHDALRDAHAPQRRDLRFSGNSGIDVRQQPGLADHELAHGDEIFDGAGVAEPAERGTRRLVAQLGLVAEREQSLAASGLASRPRDRQHLVGAQVGGARLPRADRERAISAHVATQPGERNEHLAGVRDDVAVTLPAERACRFEQPRKRRGLESRQQPVRLLLDAMRSVHARLVLTAPA